MKIKMYVCFLLAILFISCKKETPSHGNSVTKDTKMESNIENAYAFTVSDDGKVVLISENGDLLSYNEQGDCECWAQNLEDVTAICYYNEEVFAYDMCKGLILGINQEGFIRTISEDFFVYEMLNMEVCNGNILALIVPLKFNGFTTEDGYMNMQESLFSISLTDGKREKLNCENIMDFSCVSKEEIVYYSWSERGYRLKSLNLSNFDEKVISENNIFNNDYVSSVELIGDIAVYSELNSPGIHFIEMESGREVFYEDGRLILCGAECWKFGEKVIYRCINGDGLYEMKSFDVTDFKK